MIKRLIILTIFACSHFVVEAREIIPNTANTWQGGLGIGNFPIHGSFKTSLTGGYFITDKLYVGAIYQLRDEIKKNNSSFNAKSAELGGLVRATYYSAPRLLIQGRYTPFKCGAYVSAGIVVNGESQEDMSYNVQKRTIIEEPKINGIRIEQRRSGGWGLGLGIGYQHNFSKHISANIEWTPAWFQHPKPSYKIIASPANLTNAEMEEIISRMDDAFKRRLTNMYQVIHIGIAYRFKI